VGMKKVGKRKEIRARRDEDIERIDHQWGSGVNNWKYGGRDTYVPGERYIQVTVAGCGGKRGYRT